MTKEILGLSGECQAVSPLTPVSPLLALLLVLIGHPPRFESVLRCRDVFPVGFPRGLLHDPSRKLFVSETCGRNTLLRC
jgi:hypothetical protein